MAIDRNLSYTPKFVYFLGYFAADGSLYKDKSGPRFEFSDGADFNSELVYSKMFLKRIGNITSVLFGTKINLRKRGNRFVLAFRNKELAEFLKNNFDITPGVKTYSVDIPKHYKRTEFEKYFWLGFMDGDGMVARNSRKIAVECASQKIMASFKDFLDREQIKYEYSERELFGVRQYGIRLSSAFFSDYAGKLGFLHPRKRKWLLAHLKKKEFYIRNEADFDKYLLENHIFDYQKIFHNEPVFVVNGIQILREFGMSKYAKKNQKLSTLIEFLEEKKLSKTEIYTMLQSYKFKMSKGSAILVKLPLRISPEIKELAQFVRFNAGSIRLSKNYAKAMGLNFEKLVSCVVKIFDIEPEYTCKNETFFSSGVVSRFFSKFINKKIIVVMLPEWHNKIIN